jgi:hypothetical protein
MKASLLTSPSPALPANSPYCVVRGASGFFLCDMAGKRVTEFYGDREGALGEKRIGTRSSTTPSAKGVRGQMEAVLAGRKPRKRPSLYCRCCGGVLGPGEHGRHRSYAVCLKIKGEKQAAASPVAKVTGFFARVFKSKSA